MWFTIEDARQQSKPGSALEDYDAIGTFTCIASRHTVTAERRNIAQMMPAAAKSGHGELRAHTAPAAMTTITFAATSLREQIHTERMFTSSPRCRHSNEKHHAFAASAMAPITPLPSKSGIDGWMTS